jgi:hypothetical protein
MEGEVRMMPFIYQLAIWAYAMAIFSFIFVTGIWALVDGLSLFADCCSKVRLRK